MSKGKEIVDRFGEETGVEIEMSHILIEMIDDLVYELERKSREDMDRLSWGVR